MTNSKSTKRALLGSVLSIVICLAMLLGTTFAWFTDSVISADNNLTAANFHITAEVKKDGTGAILPADTADGEYRYTLYESETYLVTLTTSGTANEFGGYCVIKCGDTIYHSVQMKPDSSITFSVSGSAVLSLIPSWGTYANSSGEGLVDDGAVIPVSMTTLFTLPSEADSGSEDNDSSESETNNGTYIVKSGDTLSRIAAANNTTVKKLQAYNEIENVNNIQIGQELKIPPVNYEIPVTSTIGAAESEISADISSETETSSPIET